MVELAFGVPREQMRVIHNGIDAETFRPLSITKDPNNVIYVGNSEDRTKGAAYLLQAFRLLARYDALPPDLRRPAAAGAEAGPAPRRAIRPEREGALHRAGRHRAELVQHYNRAEMLACPSLYEGFGLPAGEAMACGLPVAATTGGALPEVVEDGVTGILVPPGDAPALAEAIQTLMGDADLRRRMGQAGRERVLEKFSWPRAALETEAVYREVLGGRCRSSGPGAAQPRRNRAA